jgi:hypothetical protein
MSEHWPPTANVPAPSIDPNFQRQLTEIFGTSPDGRPKLRAIWGMEAREFFHEQYRMRYPCGKVKRFANWGVPSIGADGKVSGWLKFPPTATPPTKKQTGGRMVMKLMERTIIGTPRWFIEQWVGPHVAGQRWEEERWEWKWDPVQGVNRRVDMLGPPPRDGMYLAAEYVYPFMLAVHQGDGLCCVNKRKEGFRCYGQYRDPDDRDLFYISSLVDELMDEPYLYSYDALPPREVVEASLQKRLDQMAEQERKEEVRLVEGLKDEIRPHAKRLVTDGGRLDKETYHFQGIGKGILNRLRPK